MGMNSGIQTHLGLLERLRAVPGDWVSGQALCGELDCSRTAIWKHIEHLRQLGYTIEARPRRGYRLFAAPDTPIPEEVQPRLTTTRLGRGLTWLAAVDSTNRWLGERADAGAPEGAAVTADAQNAGRGRLDRAWHSPPGLNLYASVLLRPAVPLDRVASLSLVLGLAVRRAILELAPGLEPRLKWPNDVWIGSRKLCGILCDMRAEPEQVRHVVAGIGLNVNIDARDFPAEFAAGATSLRIESGKTMSRALVLAAILNNLEPLYDAWIADGLAPFRKELDKADLLRGRRVTLSQGTGLLHGTARGIAPDGALLLDGLGGPLTVYSGDVSVRSISGLKESP
jgi:BirA family biotin operon repressor/biotin-[acetyl-CoA-carboxylase] ligase